MHSFKRALPLASLPFSFDILQALSARKRFGVGEITQASSLSVEEKRVETMDVRADTLQMAFVSSTNILPRKENARDNVLKYDHISHN